MEDSIFLNYRIIIIIPSIFVAFFTLEYKMCNK